MYHLDTNHLTDTGDSERPPLPLELIVMSHITRDEELKIGIDPDDIDDYRDDEVVFASDDIQGMIDDERELEGRKRGMSEVSMSTTYSESRQPPATKVQRM